MLRWFERIAAAFKKPIVEPGHPGWSTQGSVENAPPAVPTGTSLATAAAAAVSAAPSTTALGADAQSVPAAVVEDASPAAPDTADARIAPAAVLENAGPAAPDTADARIPPAAAGEDAAPVARDIPIAEAAPVQDTAPAAPDPHENQRRRELVRTFFNDFWSGRDDKPATFQQRLDQAEIYLNERLAACGESWRFDADARKALSLPSRSRPSARDESITS
jgi:hypothetical protein